MTEAKDLLSALAVKIYYNRMDYCMNAVCLRLEQRS